MSQESADPLVGSQGCETVAKASPLLVLPQRDPKCSQLVGIRSNPLVIRSNPLVIRWNRLVTPFGSQLSTTITGHDEQMSERLP